MTGYTHVYILASEVDPRRHYVGVTQSIATRLNAHNSGRCPHTANHRPWRFETVIAFRSLRKASAFERYLKTHSGRAFASKHF